MVEVDATNELVESVITDACIEDCDINSPANSIWPKAIPGSYSYSSSSRPSPWTESVVPVELKSSLTWLFVDLIYKTSTNIILDLGQKVAKLA